MELKVGDIITLKKNHPCGSSQFLIKRVGIDIGIKCLGCEHYALIDRKKIEKNIKSISKKS